MASKKEGVTRLQGVPMFSDLSKRELERLWEQMKIVQHAAGHRIVAEGSPGYGFQLILEGTAQVQRGGGRKIELGPGAFFGEMSVIDDGPRTASVTAATPMVTAALTSSGCKSFLTEHPQAMWKLLVHLAARLREEQSATANLVA